MADAPWGGAAAGAAGCAGAVSMSSNGLSDERRAPSAGGRLVDGSSNGFVLQVRELSMMSMAAPAKPAAPWEMLA
eukprot:4737722-Prymnesium_polylepis.1